MKQGTGLAGFAAQGAPWWCDLRLLGIRAFLWQAVGTFGMVRRGFTWAGIGVLAPAGSLNRT